MVCRRCGGAILAALALWSLEARAQATAAEAQAAQAGPHPTAAPTAPGGESPVSPAASLVPLSLAGMTGALHASYRLLGWGQPALQLGRRDASTPIETLGKKTFLEHRLRVGADLEREGLSLRFEADLVNGLLRAGSDGFVLSPNAPPPLGAPQPDLANPLRNRAWGVNPSSFALRELALRYRTSLGQLTFGATTFSFGQGMLASAGNGPIDAEAGDQRFGDRVVRLAFSTRPLSLLFGAGAPDLTVALAADLVLSDATATLFRPLADWGSKGAVQDTAFAGVLAAVHKGPGRELGLFVTRRSVRSPDSPALVPGATVPFSSDIQLWAVDAAGDLRRPAEGGVEIYAGAEGALVFGDTNRVRNSSCPGGGSGGRCKILQGGVIGRAGIRGGGVGFDLLAGFASGDADPFDDQATGFQLNRDLQVGMILFDQVLAWQSAAMVRRATDPLLSNAAQPGVELLSTNGAVTNAIFVQPTLRGSPLPGLQLWGSVLWAIAPQPVADVYWTLKSSAPANAFGLPAGKSYGLELDVGANWAQELRPGLRLHAGLAAGVLLPGDAFTIDAAGNKMDSVARLKARAAISF